MLLVQTKSFNNKTNAQYLMLRLLNICSKHKTTWLPIRTQTSWLTPIVFFGYFLSLATHNHMCKCDYQAKRLNKHILRFVSPRWNMVYVHSKVPQKKTHTNRSNSFFSASKRPIIIWCQQMDVICLLVWYKQLFLFASPAAFFRAIHKRMR